MSNDPLIKLDLYGLEESRWSSFFKSDYAIDTEKMRQRNIAVLHAGADIAVDTGIFAAHAGFCLSLPFRAPFWLMGKGSLSSDWRSFQASNEAFRDAGERWKQRILPADLNNQTYLSWRSGSKVFMETGLLMTGIGTAKGAVAFGEKGYSWMRSAFGAKEIQRSLKWSSRELKKVEKSLVSSNKISHKSETFINRGASFAGSKRFPLNYAHYQTVRNNARIINGRKYTGHALDRMQDRGFMPSIIDNTIKNGNVSPADFPGGLNYYDPVNRIKVVVGEGGQIVTVIPGRG